MESERRAGKIRQAGAIAVRRHGARLRFLLVRSRRQPENWIFPKGHIEPGEDPESAALRELREEAGVAGTLLDYVGPVEFLRGGDRVQVDYFAVRYSGSVPPDEQREKRWLDLEEALETVSFDDARALLRRAAALLDVASWPDRRRRK